MDLQQIKYFLAVVDLGTFMAASEHVHVSQPTLSAGIRKLEESLNVKLFNRGSRAASLTPAGELFLVQARPSYNQLMSIKSKLATEQSRITLGVLNTIPMDHVAEVIKIYKATHPTVFVELCMSNHEELLQMLKVKKLDLIFTIQDKIAENFTLLFQEQLSVVVSTQHPFSKFKELEIKQLDNQAFIERIRCESWSDVHTAFQKNNIHVDSVCRVESDESVLSLVAANLGVSIMPVRETPYEVKFIPIKDLKITRPIGVCVSSKLDAPQIQHFHELIMARYKTRLASE